MTSIYLGSILMITQNWHEANQLAINKRGQARPGLEPKTHGPEKSYLTSSPDKFAVQLQCLSNVLVDS